MAKVHERSSRSRSLPEVALIDANRVARVLAEHPALVEDTVLDALRLHVERKLVAPLKQYLQRAPDAHPADRIIAMSAYVPPPYDVAGVKWIGSHPDNRNRGLARANAVIVLNDTLTNAPIAIVDGTLISLMRTHAVALICLERFRPEPAVVACLGMGRLGRVIVETLPARYPSVAEIRCFSNAPYDDLLASPGIRKCRDYREALEGADVIVAATTAPEPYIRTEEVSEDAVIVNLSLMDFHLDVFVHSSALVVDDLEQCSKAKKVFNRGIESGLIEPSGVYELSSVLFGAHAGERFTGRILVNPIGMAIEDVLVARAVHRIVESEGVTERFTLG
jgi:N-[(2S)-2-amino-2-carboxyethyl]-L-glutamate dehydrogenase